MNWLRSFIGSQGREAIHRKNKYVLPPEDGLLMADVGRTAAAHMKKMGFEIDPKSLLGKGAFGKVFKATFAGAPAACKVIDLSFTVNIQNLVPRELDILRSELFHENIVTIYAAFEPPEDRLVDGNYTDKVYIFMELLSIDLFGHVEDKNGLNDEEARFLFKQIAAGLEYLHSQDVAHRDVKPENVLLNEDRTVAKLTDFGLSVRVGIDPETGTRTRSATVTGTIYTVAPQVHYPDLDEERKLYDAQLADVFSLGVTLFFMFESMTPFSEGLSDHLLVQEKMNREYVFLRPISATAKDFIDYLMTPKEEERPTVTQALEHPWIRSGLSAAAQPPFEPAAPIRIQPRDDTQWAAEDFEDTPPAAAADFEETPPTAAAASGPINPFLYRALGRDWNPRHRQGPGGARVRLASRSSRAEGMGFSLNFPGAPTDRDARDEDADDDLRL